MAQAKSRARGAAQQKPNVEADDKAQEQSAPTVEDTADNAAEAPTGAVESGSGEPGQEQDAGEEPTQDQESHEAPATGGPDLDLARFTGAAPTTTGTRGEATEVAQVKQTGHTVEDTADTAAEAVVLVDVYSITTAEGSFITARKGDTVRTTAEAVERGVRQGLLRKP